MMLIPLLNQYQDAQDGLFLLMDNYKTQDTAVGPFGVHHLVTPPHSTGVVRRSVVLPLAACALIMVLRPAPTRLTRSVFVPSGVWLIDTCTLILVFCTPFFYTRHYGRNFCGYIIKPFSIYIRNSTKQRAKFAAEPQSINSYYGMMRHINCYNLRKSIALRNHLNMIQYEKLALKSLWT